MDCIHKTDTNYCVMRPGVRVLCIHPHLLQVDLRRASSAVFRANMAVESGGAIFGDESSTSFTANEYNHSLAENRFGFCFILFGNEGRPGASEVSHTIPVVVTLIPYCTWVVVSVC